MVYAVLHGGGRPHCFPADGVALGCGPPPAIAQPFSTLLHSSLPATSIIFFSTKLFLWPHPIHQIAPGDAENIPPGSLLREKRARGLGNSAVYEYESPAIRAIFRIFFLRTYRTSMVPCTLLIFGTNRATVGREGGLQGQSPPQRPICSSRRAYIPAAVPEVCNF